MNFKRSLVVLLAFGALLIPSSASASSQSRIIKELRAENQCLRARIGWYGGEATAYFRAWNAASDVISDVVYGRETSDALWPALRDASKDLNAYLNRIEITPRCNG